MYSGGGVDIDVQFQFPIPGKFPLSLFIECPYRLVCLTVSINCMWQGIYGHDDVADRFRRLLKSGRLASSYLFLGPPGVGKRTFALKLAKALLCLRSEEGGLDPCDDCDSCRLADAGTHPDVDVVGLPEGKRELPISVFLGDKEHRHKQGLCHNIGLRPMMGRRRVAIIDDADGLNPESANCLLKTLEEPPPGAVLILIGTNRSRQLPTILSRAQIVSFQPLPADVVARLIMEQGLVTTEEEAQKLAAESNGSLQRVSEFLSLNLGEFRSHLWREISGTSINAMRLVSFINEFVAEGGTESEFKRRRLRAAIDLVTEHFRRKLRQGKSGDSMNRAEESRLLAILDRCVRAEDELDRNANLATLLECWIDDLTGLTAPAVVLR